MVPLRSCRHVPALFDQPQCRCKIAPICQGTCHDDTALVYHCRVGAGRAQFIPKFIHITPASKCAMTIGQHCVLLGAPRQLAKRLELYNGRRPAPEAVKREPVQLADLGNARCELGQSRRKAKRLREPVMLVRTSGRIEIGPSLACGGGTKNTREGNREVLHLTRARWQRLTQDDRVCALADLARLESFDAGWRTRWQCSHSRFVRPGVRNRR